MKFFILLDQVLTLLEKTIISVGLATATLLLFANVVARYAFDSGFPWVLEVVQYLFAWVVLIGAAHGFKSGIHLGIDILVEKFPPTVRHWIGVLSLALCLFFVLSVLYLSLQYIWRIYQWQDLTMDLRIPQWIPYLAIPVGLTLMSIRLLQLGWRIWKGELHHVGRSEQDNFRGNLE